MDVPRLDGRVVSRHFFEHARPKSVGQAFLSDRNLLAALPFREIESELDHATDAAVCVVFGPNLAL